MSTVSIQKQVHSSYVLNQKRNGQDTPLKSKKLREAIALSVDKKGLANVILNNGSKATDQLVPKGLATGPDGKDYQDTFKNGLKYNPKKEQQRGRSEKRAWKRSSYN